MKVLSMFDGISCGRVALDRLGIVPEVYFASEIDKYAERVSADNWTDIARLGDAYGVDGWNIGPVDLLLGGSPCTHWSIAQRNRETESSGIGWELFSLYTKSLARYKPRYFIYENVKSMSPAIRAEITRSLGVEPIAINSALVSAQNRQRLYWTNIPGVEQPEDKGIYLVDIIESGIVDREKSRCIEATYQKKNPVDYIEKQRSQMIFERAENINGAAWRGRDSASRYEVRRDGKSNAITAAGHQSRLLTICVNSKSGRGGIEGLQPSLADRIYNIAGKSPTVTTAYTTKVAVPTDGPEMPQREVYQVKNGTAIFRGKPYKINLPDGFYILRKLTVNECCRLQTMPDNYCKSVSPSAAYKAIGNGWTVDVIAHILGYMSK